MPKRETWKSWARAKLEPAPAPEDLLTKEEILELVGRLTAGAMRPSEREFRHLQDLGLVPLPTLQRRDGRRLGVFPAWVAELAAVVLLLRREGLGWEQIRQQVPTRDRARSVLGNAEAGTSVRLPDELMPHVDALGAWFAQEFEPVSEIRLTFVDRHGYPWPLRFRWRPDEPPP